MRFAARPEDEEAVEGLFGDGRIHAGGGSRDADPFVAVVDYSARIARWIREQGWPGAQEQEDGGLHVHHRVTDAEWLIRHVLTYGPEARVVEPAWLRERVVQVLRSTARAAQQSR